MSLKTACEYDNKKNENESRLLMVKSTIFKSSNAFLRRP